MLKLTLPQLLASGFALTLLMGGCAAAPAADSLQTKVAAPKSDTTVSLKAGEVLQFAFFKASEGEAAEAVRRTYFQTAIPYAESLGDELIGSLKVEQIMMGENTPQGLQIYKFPNQAAQDSFMAAPDWETYQQMRRDGWDELHIFSTTVAEDMSITLNPEKNYTIAVAWTRPGTDGDYETYLDGIEADFDTIGAKYVARFEGVDLQSTTDSAADPSHLTFVEWTENPDLKALQKTQGYKDNSPSFRKAISRFDFYWVSPTPS